MTEVHYTFQRLGGDQTLKMFVDYKKIGTHRLTTRRLNFIQALNHRYMTDFSMFIMILKVWDVIKRTKY